MTDSFGRKINFKNCLIIMTSNLGVKKLQDFGGGIGFGTSKNVYTDQETKKSLLNKELKNYFAPEFINRLDEIIVFNSLSTDNVEKIVNIELTKLKNRLSDLKFNINFDKSCIDYITKIGFDDVYGARPLKRAIQDKFEDFISDEVLKGVIFEDTPYELSIDDETVSIKELKEKVKKTRKKKGE